MKVIFYEIASSFHQLFQIEMNTGAFCQFSFWWIYYYGSNKPTGKEIAKPTSVHWYKSHGNRLCETNKQKYKNRKSLKGLTKESFGNSGNDPKFFLPIGTKTMEIVRVN